MLVVGWICWVISAGCILAAAIMDYLYMEVYRFFWWIGYLFCSLSYLILVAERVITVKGSLVLQLWIFVICQHKYFSSKYGKADCHGFSLCAFLLLCWNQGIITYLEQMIVAFLALGIVQICVKNVTWKGVLKKPVAFLPYIFLSFLWTMVQIT